MPAKRGFSVISTAIDEFGKDNVPGLAAAISFYAIFSLPPLLILLVMLAGRVAGADLVQGTLQQEIRKAAGPETASVIESMLRSTYYRGSGTTFRIVASGVALLLGATGAFGMLQTSIDIAWNVRPDPKSGGFLGILRYLVVRGLSLILIFILAVVLIVSVLLSAYLNAFGGIVAGYFPKWISSYVLIGINELFFLGVLILIFAVVFKLLPDGRADWDDVWVGSVVTALLFTLGKFLLGIYFGRSRPASLFGAAGSLALVLLWIYYSAIIFLLGAELIQARMGMRKRTIVPKKGAVRVVTQVIHPPDEKGEPPKDEP